MEEVIGEAAKTDEVQTSIDIKDGVMTVVINMKRGQVNCYGTLQFAQEMGSRFFLTQELAKKRAAQEEENSSRIRLTLPGIKK
jgi:hypothetical protein